MASHILKSSLPICALPSTIEAHPQGTSIHFVPKSVGAAALQLGPLRTKVISACVQLFLYFLALSPLRSTPMLSFPRKRYKFNFASLLTSGKVALQNCKTLTYSWSNSAVPKTIMDDSRMRRSGVALPSSRSLRASRHRWGAVKAFAPSIPAVRFPLFSWVTRRTAKRRSFLLDLDAVADQTTGIKVGADDFLTKPVHEGELMARIATAHTLKHAIDRRMGPPAS
jgi:hypothetical protein